MGRQQHLPALHGAPLIIDNFAGGVGASLGIELALGRGPDVAVDHDPEAVAMHAENHPATRHLCESVWAIGMRMLRPRELYRAQGFPDRYRIEMEIGGRPMTKEAQVRMVGNSVCPPLAAAIVRANCADLAIDEDRERAA